MNPEETDRRYRYAPDEARQEREAAEDRAADHAPADPCASGQHHACTCRGERLREALAVARDLRTFAAGLDEGAPIQPEYMDNLADRLDGGRS